MPTNQLMKPGWQRAVVVSDPATPSSGDAVRHGLLTGVALTDEGGGGNAATETTVDFGPGIWDLPVVGEAGAISPGDAVFYDDAIDGLNNDAANGYFFGIALEAVENAATTTIHVLHLPTPGAGSLGAGTVGTAALAANALAAGAAGRAKMQDGYFDAATALAKIAANAFTNAVLDSIIAANGFAADADSRAKFAAGIWTQDKLDPASLDGTVAKVVANANVIGGVPVLFRIDCADASANVDVVSTHKIRVIDAWALNTGIAAHAANDTWQVKNGANAISDAVAKTATVNAIKRISTIDPAQAEIAAGGTLRITTVKDTNAAVTVYVLAIRVA
jgi:predicted RecA/RadA family phage recombinase